MTFKLGVSLVAAAVPDGKYVAPACLSQISLKIFRPSDCKPGHRVALPETRVVLPLYVDGAFRPHLRAVGDIL